MTSRNSIYSSACPFSYPVNIFKPKRASLPDVQIVEFDALRGISRSNKVETVS